MRYAMRNPFISIGQPAGSKKFNNNSLVHTVADSLMFSSVTNIVINKMRIYLVFC